MKTDKKEVGIGGSFGQNINLKKYNLIFLKIICTKKNA